jgi:integrase
MTSLTNRVIQAALPGSVIRDPVVPGLHVRVFTERRSFYLYYRTKTGLERRPKLGDFGVLTVDAARKIAREMLATVAAGGDPIGDRESAKRAPTVAELADRYLQQYADKNKKQRSRDEDERQIEKYLLPRLGARKVYDVQHEDIERLHESMKDTPHQANRVLSLLSKMFNLAEKWRLREPFTNPCRHVARYKEAKRRRYMTADEAPRIAELLRAAESTAPRAVLFIYLLVLSGARPDEIARACREDILPRSVGGVLHMQDTKTGARDVYLPPQIMDLLARLPKKTGSLTGIRSPKKLWDRVRVAAGCPDLRLYDLRHSFATAALRAGYSLEQIGELLGHRSTQTTKRYAHLDDGMAQKAAAGTATVLERMLNPSPDSDAGFSSSPLPRRSALTRLR